MPNPANTSKLFQGNPRNELRISWIFLNIQARLSLDFSCRKNNPLYNGVLVWNTLAVNIIDIETFSKFKNHLKKLAHDVTMLNI